MAPEQRRRPTGVKQIEASEICSQGEMVSAMIDNLRELQSQSNELRDSMQQVIARGKRINEQRKRHASSEWRVFNLRQDIQRRKEGLARLREEVSSAGGHRAQHGEARQRRWAELREAQDQHHQTVTRLRDTYGGLQELWQQRRCRQMMMLHEVSLVYPIENRGQYWTIRGLCLGAIDTPSRQDLREEESVSTALGYMAHLLVTLSGILEVPLRINVHQVGCSRSFLSDPHESADTSTLAGPREWPLHYGRGLERSRFEAALRLLRDGLHQFLYSRGYFDERRLASKNNLLECAKLILQRELYGADSL